MKYKFITALFAVLASISMVSCGGGKKIDTSVTITVNFYIDYNYAAEEIIYHTCDVYLNAKITDIPSNPDQNIFADFPNFLGWSSYQLINDVDDLWDFEKDIVDTTYSTLSIYGIWVE